MSCPHLSRILHLNGIDLYASPEIRELVEGVVYGYVRVQIGVVQLPEDQATRRHGIESVS